MDINKLLKGVQCACGKLHTCDINYVYIEDNAIRHLTDICKQDNQILIVADENTFAAAGEQVLSALDGKQLVQVIFGGCSTLIPDEKAIAAVEKYLDGMDIIVGIGSGVIQDLCKYVSHYNKIPYIIVATAPSMDGYASNGAAMITGGMKVTYPAGLPRAILADVEVLRNAPMEMLQAGYGDVIGKFSALNDWKLSHLINNEYFCDYIYNLTYAQVKTVIELANGILIRDKDSVQALMNALVVIGILMSFAGSSRPASGSEHHLSHFFEITGILENKPYFSHGLEVAYSTVVTAMLREQILSKAFPCTIYRPEKEIYTKKMQEIYGSSAQGCMQLQEKVGCYERHTAEMYLTCEQDIRSILAEMPTGKEIRELLGFVDLDIQTFFDHYGKEKIENAILYAKELKDRYTVLWLYYDLFGGEPVAI